MAAVGTPAVTALALLLGGAAPAVAGPSSALEQARMASEHVSFDGVLDVQWRDGGQIRLERLTVRAVDGTLLVQGGNQVMARNPFERLVARAGHGWDEVWLPGLGPGPRPDGVDKYQVGETGGGPVVAGRPTRAVDVMEQGLVRERLFLDTATNLLLKRDQYGQDGTIVRTVAFESVAITQDVAHPADPPSPTHHEPRLVSSRSGAAATAADSLAEGYRRLGVYRTGDALHALYSDGLYDLSVFQQAGRLQRSDLPAAGEPVAMGTTTGWHYSWAGGQLLVWAANGRVFTAVSDAPLDQVLRAARSLPTLPSPRASLGSKLRRACQTLMEPLR
jgi:hypothetical protein